MAASTAGLQCGHDPEAVENLAKFGKWPPQPNLQCGHDPEAVESVYAFIAYNGWDFVLQCGHDPEAVESGPRRSVTSAVL